MIIDREELIKVITALISNHNYYNLNIPNDVLINKAIEIIKTVDNKIKTME